MKWILSLLFMSSAALASLPSEEIVVRLKQGQVLPAHLKIKSAQNLFSDVYVLRTENKDEVISDLNKFKGTEYVEEAHRFSAPLPAPLKEKVPEALFAESLFNDPLVNKVWSFNDAANSGVSVNAAYKVYGTSNTTPVIVAVVDTGVDYRHEDLKNVMWTNPGEIAGNGVDDDNNGYVDDVYGINTLMRDSKDRATGNIMDTHSHGTHVSGTIGASQNNKIGIAGIASNVKIMALRTVPNNGDETDINVAESFIYAAKNGAKIINCSFGKSKNEGGKLIPDTLKYIAEQYGVLVIAAAGNDSDDIDKNPTYPASFNNDNLLIVASTTSSGRMSGFSNYGLINVDVAAPGSSIYSTTPGNRYESMSGTSMATPTTVGVAAEILSHYPELSASKLKEVLIKSVTQVDSFKNKMVSGGRIDLLKGLEFARTIK